MSNTGCPLLKTLFFTYTIYTTPSLFTTEHLDMVSFYFTLQRKEMMGLISELLQAPFQQKGALTTEYVKVFETNTCVFHMFSMSSMRCT